MFLLFALLLPLSGLANKDQNINTEIMTRNIDSFMSPAYNFDGYIVNYQSAN